MPMAQFNGQAETNLYTDDPVEKAVWETVFYFSLNPGSIVFHEWRTQAAHTVQDYLHHYYPTPATQAEINNWNSVIDGGLNSVGLPNVFIGDATSPEIAQNYLTANVTRIHPVPGYRQWIVTNEFIPPPSEF